MRNLWDWIRAWHFFFFRVLPWLHHAAMTDETRRARIGYPATMYFHLKKARDYYHRLAREQGLV